MGRTKAKLTNNEVALGAWITIPSPVIIEILQDSGHFDWLALDLEHAPFDNRTIYEMVRASNGNCDILARLPSTNPDIAKQVLDAGVDGIIVPDVRDTLQAKLVRNMAKYPLDGNRSMAICRANNYGNNIPNYHSAHNDKVIVVIMIENVVTIGDNLLWEMVNISRADAVLIGPYDLSSSMGIPAQFKNPKFQKAIDSIKSEVEPHCAPGIHVASVDPGLVAEYKERGFRFIACGLDTEMLKFGAKHTLGL